jgi:hypothetical protein
MKSTIIVPAVAGIAGLFGARLVGVESGLLQFVIGVGCMVLGGVVLVFIKKRGK